MAALREQIGAIMFIDAHGIIRKKKIPESKNVLYQAQTGGCGNLSTPDQAESVKIRLLEEIIGRHRSFDVSVTDAIGQLLVESKSTATLSSAVATDKSVSLRSTYSLYPSSDIHDRVFDRNSDWGGDLSTQTPDDKAQNAFEYKRHQIATLWKHKDVYCSIQDHGNWFDFFGSDEVTLSQICNRFEMPPGFKLLIVSVACDTHSHDPHRVDLGTEEFDIAAIKKHLAREWDALWAASNPRFNRSQPLGPELQAEKDRSVELTFQELQRDAKATGKTIESVLRSYQKPSKGAGNVRKTKLVSKKRRRTRKH